MKTRIRGIFGALMLVVSSILLAQQTAGQAATKSAAPKAAAVKRLMDRAEAARKTGDVLTAVKLFKQAIVAEPGNEETHQGLSTALYYSETNRLKAEAKASEKDGGKAAEESQLAAKISAAQYALLVEFYRPLAASHPKVTAYRYHLLVAETRLAEAEHKPHGDLRVEIEKIVAADPMYFPALFSLGASAGARGDVAKEREYFCRASEARPGDDMAAYFCLQTFKTGDPKEYRRRLDEFVARHPKSMNAEYVLEKAANDADSPEDRMALLERASSLPGTYYVADLLGLYARTDVRKAADVAREKLKAAQGGHAVRGADAEISKYQLSQLKEAADYFDKLAQAERLLKTGQLAAAKVAIEKAKLPDDAAALFSAFPKTKLMAEVLLAQGSASKAYQFLLDDRQVIADPAQTAMAVKLGAQLGKGEAQVQEEIVSAVLSSAKQPHDFQLENLKGDAKVKLSDFRGKYVLVNFWHPT